MADAPKRSKTFWLAVGCAGLAALMVPCVGVIAGIAIPAFVSYTRRAKTAEARANLGAIRAGVASYCTENGHLPDAVAPTSPAPGEARQMPHLDPGWASVGFAPIESLYYAYSIERPDASTARLVAEGDLDDDGTRSRFEITCTASGTACDCGDVAVTNELE